jgi:hypothetical protein
MVRLLKLAAAALIGFVLGSLWISSLNGAGPSAGFAGLGMALLVFPVLIAVTVIMHVVLLRSKYADFTSCVLLALVAAEVSFFVNPF